MTELERHRRSSCPSCGWPAGEAETVVSRHPVSDGTIVYAHCVCGLLRVWHEAAGSAAEPARLVVAGRCQATRDAAWRDPSARGR
ncbi:hypothetical protein [Streptomyces boninensis]|uniref:hypothetical protein n=1 Tax=Streptomyces boninensis TaxID=2039455 RepID=UPI003B21FA79